jgi:hypothetical protein
MPHIASVNLSLSEWNKPQPEGNLAYRQVHWTGISRLEESKTSTIRALLGMEISDPSYKMNDDKDITVWYDRVKPNSTLVDAIITSETKVMCLSRGAVDVYRDVDRLYMHMSRKPDEVPIEYLLLKKVSDLIFQVLEIQIGNFGT